MRYITLVFCFLAPAAMADSNWRDCALTEHGYVCPKHAENDPTDTMPLPAPDTLPKSPDKQIDKTKRAMPACFFTLMDGTLDLQPCTNIEVTPTD